MKVYTFRALSPCKQNKEKTKQKKSKINTPTNLRGEERNLLMVKSTATFYTEDLPPLLISRGNRCVIFKNKNGLEKIQKEK